MKKASTLVAILILLVSLLLTGCQKPEATLHKETLVPAQTSDKPLETTPAPMPGTTANPAPFTVPQGMTTLTPPPDVLNGMQLATLSPQWTQDEVQWLRHALAGQAYSYEWYAWNTDPVMQGGISDMLVVGDEVWLCAPDEHRIYRTSFSGEVLGTIGMAGQGPEELLNPISMSMYADKIYVGDTANNRIQILDPTGAFIGALSLDTQPAKDAHLNIRDARQLKLVAGTKGIYFYHSVSGKTTRFVCVGYDGDIEVFDEQPVIVLSDAKTMFYTPSYFILNGDLYYAGMAEYHKNESKDWGYFKWNWKERGWEKTISCAPDWIGRPTQVGDEVYLHLNHQVVVMSSEQFLSQQIFGGIDMMYVFHSYALDQSAAPRPNSRTAADQMLVLGTKALLFKSPAAAYGALYFVPRQETIATPAMAYQQPWKIWQAPQDYLLKPLSPQP